MKNKNFVEKKKNKRQYISSEYFVFHSMRTTHKYERHCKGTAETISSHIYTLD
jgi:hypothetical protein